MKEITIVVPDIKRVGKEARVLVDTMTKLFSIGTELIKKKVFIRHPEEPKKTYNASVMVKWNPFNVAGVTFDGRQEVIATFNGDETVRLEQQTFHDREAVAIFIGDKQVGFIPDFPRGHSNSKAKIVWDKLAKGKTVNVIGWKRIGGGAPGIKFGIQLEIETER
jgi:hypothetical protein